MNSGKSGPGTLVITTFTNGCRWMSFATPADRGAGQRSAFASATEFAAPTVLAFARANASCTSWRRRAGLDSPTGSGAYSEVT